jgi:hypothetical protein
MGLILQVAPPSKVFLRPFAAQVQQELEKQLHYSIPTDTPSRRRYESHDLPWSGWASLQELAASVLGEDKIPHHLETV